MAWKDGPGDTPLTSGGKNDGKGFLLFCVVIVLIWWITR